MSGPGVRIADFFDKLSKSATGKDGYSFGDFCSQYWYVW